MQFQCTSLYMATLVWMIICVCLLFFKIGGEVTVEKDLSSVSLGPNPMPELAHVIIGIESPCHQVSQKPKKPAWEL